jgi:hypothetical protein
MAALRDITAYFPSDREERRVITEALVDDVASEAQKMLAERQALIGRASAILAAYEPVLPMPPLPIELH